MTPPFTFLSDGSMSIAAPIVMANGVRLFTSTASPNGVITPLQVGDMCVTTEPGLYLAQSVEGDFPWLPVGYVQPICQWGIDTITPYSSFKTTNVAMTGGASQNGLMIDIVTVPLLTYAPGAVVYNGQSADIGLLPPSTVAYGISIYVNIVSLDAANALSATWSVTSDVGANALSLSGALIPTPVITGSDLVFQVDGTVITTAGGAYGITGQLTAGWI